MSLSGTTPQTPFISVIIPTYCRPLSLDRCLASLARQDFPRESFEVIVVDDGGEPSVDAGASAAAGVSLHLIFMRRPHRGVAAARTAGIKRARGELLAFLDDDCTVRPDYLRSIENVFAKHPETMIVQVGLENAEPRNIYGQAWKFALEQALKSNLHPAQNDRLTCGILGGVMAARRELFRLTAYDRGFTSGREDADLRYQLQKLDIPVYYEPDIAVFHYYRQSLRSCLATFFAYGRGEFHLQYKWKDTPSPFRYATVISWRAFMSLLRTEGVRRGTAVYLIVLLKRNASLWGVLYEKSASALPERAAHRWARFGWLLLASYAACAACFGLATLKRILRTMQLSGWHQPRV